MPLRVKMGRNSLKILESLMYHLMHISWLPIKVIHNLHRVGNHFFSWNWVIISVGTITAKTSVRQICCHSPCQFLCITSVLSADRALDIYMKNCERVERKRCGSCSRPNRSIGDKRMSNKPMMNPEWSLSWGPGTNALSTSHKQPVIEVHSVFEREEECERLLQRNEVLIIQSCS